ncbi:MAG TPA: TatD family hydrolase [Aestuariivirgaceae bacterium]|nr:TatD family hydrolase [Aestuariivirgaceae bacterium]
MIRAIDSHCHLDFKEFAADLPGVIARANGAGVGLMVTISTRVRKFAQTLAIAETYPGIYCSVGTHPHNAADETDVTMDELVSLAQHAKVVALGEAGLDYHYMHSPPATQAKSFRLHIEAARRTGLPLIIHSRDAEDDTASIIEEEMARGKFRALLHCYSSRRSLAERGLAVGAYISFSGILTFKNAEEIRSVAQSAPLDRILVETDAPYLAPVPHRGKINEPAFVMHTLQKLAEIRQTALDKVAFATNDNFFRLFGKVQVPQSYTELPAA